MDNQVIKSIYRHDIKLFRRKRGDKVKTFQKIKTFFEGKKTYIVAILLVAYAVIGVYTKQLTLDQGELIVLNGLGLGFLKAAIPNK